MRKKVGVHTPTVLHFCERGMCARLNWCVCDIVQVAGLLKSANRLSGGFAPLRKPATCATSHTCHLERMHNHSFKFIKCEAFWIFNTTLTTTEHPKWISPNMRHNPLAENGCAELNILVLRVIYNDTTIIIQQYTLTIPQVSPPKKNVKINKLRDSVSPAIQKTELHPCKTKKIHQFCIGVRTW